jgi:cytochrome c553
VSVRSRGWITALVLLAAFVNADADDDLAYCTVCHGANGNGNDAIRAPKIAGMEPWYIRRQLEAFRIGVRGKHPDDAAGHEMQPVGVRLRTEADIDRALAYVATFSPKPPSATIGGDVARGKQLFDACSVCHGVQGDGNEAIGAPALAGRTDWYLLTQLANYAAGIRGADPRDAAGAQMRAAIAALEDRRQMQDVVAYINTLR